MRCIDVDQDSGLDALFSSIHALENAICSCYQKEGPLPIKFAALIVAWGHVERAQRLHFVFFHDGCLDVSVARRSAYSCSAIDVALGKFVDDRGCGAVTCKYIKFSRNDMATSRRAITTTLSIANLC